MKKTPLKIITVLVIMIIFSMTLGYSVLVQKLEIMGNATIDSTDYLIEITSITVLKKEGEELLSGSYIVRSISEC